LRKEAIPYREIEWVRVSRRIEGFREAGGDPLEVGDQGFLSSVVEPARGAGDAHGGEDTIVRAEHGRGEAAHAVFLLAEVNRVASTPDLGEFGPELGWVCYGAGGLPGYRDTGIGPRARR